MGDHKVNYRTTESISSLAWLCVMAYIQFYLPSLLLWSISVTGVISIYILSRSIYKAYRASFFVSKQSEIFGFILGQGLLIGAWYQGKLGIDIAVLLSGILVMSLSFGRGLAKRMQGVQTKISMIR